MVQASCAVRRGQGEEEIDHAVFVWVLALPYQAKLIAWCRPEQTECNNDASLGTECQLSLFSFFCGIAVVVNFARGHVTSKWVIYIFGRNTSSLESGPLGKYIHGCSGVKAAGLTVT